MFATRLKILTLTCLVVGPGSGFSAARLWADEPPAAQKRGANQILAYKQDVSRLSEDAAKRYAAQRPLGGVVGHAQAAEPSAVLRPQE